MHEFLSLSEKRYVLWEGQSDKGLKQPDAGCHKQERFPNTTGFYPQLFSYGKVYYFKQNTLNFFLSVHINETSCCELAAVNALTIISDHINPFTVWLWWWDLSPKKSPNSLIFLWTCSTSNNSAHLAHYIRGRWSVTRLTKSGLYDVWVGPCVKAWLCAPLKFP